MRIDRRTRRSFLTAAALAGAGALAGARRSPAAEAPPETARLRLTSTPFGICVAPKYVAEELLRAEGFSGAKSNPQKLIVQGTDWRFLHELKKELKG
jgi:hypothetical protein